MKEIPTEKTVEVQINQYYYRPAVEGDDGYDPDEGFMVAEFDNDSSTQKTLILEDYYDVDDDVDLTDPYDSAVGQVLRMLKDPFAHFNRAVEKGDWKMYAKEEDFPEGEHLELHFYSNAADFRHFDGCVDIEVEIRQVDGWDEWELKELWSTVTGKLVKGPDVDRTKPRITADENLIDELEMEFESYIRTHPEAPRNYMLVSVILGKSDEYYRLLEEFEGL